MGIEYAHGIFVADLMWRPTLDRIEAVSGVLEAAGFRRETPLTASANLTLAYDGIEGARVAEIMGPPYHADVSDEDRYIHDAVAVFGVDFKQVSAEGYHQDIVAAPEGSPNRMRPMQLVFPATWESVVPRATRPGLFWRSGIVIDCGKNLPAISATTRELPNRGLIRDLEQAFGTALVELGWLH